MSLLVTGGAGYIGSVLVELLVERDYEVIVLDNLSTGHREAVHPKAKFILADLAEPNLLKPIFESHQIEAVIHLAAKSLVEESVRDPAAYFRANLDCGLNLLDAMRARGVEKLIFSSTASVYGEPQTVPITEEAETNPTNPYGLSKLIFEQILETYSEAYNLSFVSLRYFNAAGATKDNGPDQPGLTHLIPRVLKVALGQRESVEVYGTDYPTADGTAIRDYIHVKDLAEAHILALALDRSGAFYNLGHEEGYSVKEVIETAREVTGREIPVVESPRRLGDPAALIASSSKIKKELGWQPKYSDLEEIIRSAWEWHQRNPQGYGA